MKIFLYKKKIKKEYDKPDRLISRTDEAMSLQTSIYKYNPLSLTLVKCVIISNPPCLILGAKISAFYSWLTGKHHRAAHPLLPIPVG